MPAKGITQGNHDVCDLDSSRARRDSTVRAPVTRPTTRITEPDTSRNETSEPLPIIRWSCPQTTPTEGRLHPSPPQEMCANSDGLDHGLVCHDSPAAQASLWCSGDRDTPGSPDRPGQTSLPARPAKQPAHGEHRLAPIQILASPFCPCGGARHKDACLTVPWLGAVRDRVPGGDFVAAHTGRI